MTTRILHNTMNSPVDLMLGALHIPAQGKVSIEELVTTLVERALEHEYLATLIRADVVLLLEEVVPVEDDPLAVDPLSSIEGPDPVTAVVPEAKVSTETAKRQENKEAELRDAKILADAKEKAEAEATAARVKQAEDAAKAAKAAKAAAEKKG